LTRFLLTPLPFLKKLFGHLKISESACNSNEGSVITHSVGSVAQSLPVRWQAPPCGKIKVNSDASLNKEKNCIGIRVVARDSGGCFLGGRCIYEQVLVDPLMAEVMAAMKVVTFSREVGFFEAIFEGDSLQIVKAINANTPNLSKIGHFVESIKTELRLFRDAYSFVHVSKGLKGVARALAKEASCSLQDSVWLEKVPRIIANVLLRVLGNNCVPRSSPFGGSIFILLMK